MTTYPKLLNMDTGIHTVHHAGGPRYKVWYHVNGRKRYHSLPPHTMIEEARAHRDELYAELMADGATEVTHKDVKPRGPKPGQGKYIYKRPSFVVRIHGKQIGAYHTEDEAQVAVKSWFTAENASLSHGEKDA
jgi:hypothetical protein